MLPPNHLNAIPPLTYCRGTGPQFPITRNGSVTIRHHQELRVMCGYVYVSHCEIREFSRSPGCYTRVIRWDVLPIASLHLTEQLIRLHSLLYSFIHPSIHLFIHPPSPIHSFNFSLFPFVLLLYYWYLPQFSLFHFVLLLYYLYSWYCVCCTCCFVSLRAQSIKYITLCFCTRNDTVNKHIYIYMYIRSCF